MKLRRCAVCHVQSPDGRFHSSDHLEDIARRVRRNQPLALTEAAGELGLDPGTLRVQIHNGKLKARKVGPVWTVTPREVERYRQESRREVKR